MSWSWGRRTCGVFLQLTPTITIRRVRTWLCKRMRRYGAPCSGSAELSLFPSSVDCITNTSGYDFRKAHPYQTWRGLWMVGQQFANLYHLEEMGANLKGNVKARLKITPLDFADAEQTRQKLFLRFRDLFERFDLLLMPRRRRSNTRSSRISRPRTTAKRCRTTPIGSPDCS
jgi:hypothetical protein